MMLNESLLREFDHEMESTRKTLQRIPGDKFGYKPHEKSGTMGWLASHIAGLFDWGYTTLTTPALKLEEYKISPVPETPEALLADLERSGTQFREALSRASDEELNQVWTMTWKGQEFVRMPRIAVLRSMIMNHMIHHRGQLTVYMRLCDIPVPGLYGPSADERQPDLPRRSDAVREGVSV